MHLAYRHAVIGEFSRVEQSELVDLQISPLFPKNHVYFNALRVFSFPPTLTMMHLCITQCTYWTTLHVWAITISYHWDLQHAQCLRQGVKGGVRYISRQ